MSSRPEHTVKVGGIQLSIWANETAKGNFQSVTIKKSYKNGDTWKESKSFRPTDLVKLQLGINKVLEYLYLKPDVIMPERTTPKKGDDMPEEILPF